MGTWLSDRKDVLRILYEREKRSSVRFRYVLLAFDVVTILYVIATSFLPQTAWMAVCDVLIGIVILADISARIWLSRNRVRDLLHPYGIADLTTVGALLAPYLGHGFAFLRVARIFRVMRSYQTLRRLRRDFPFFRRYEQTIVAVINLAMFLFVTTAVVFESERGINPNIHTYVDALYFSVTALTTTGFGDVTLTGTFGKLLTIVIMICGVSLFLRLVQVVLRPAKVEHKCPTCGLIRHDYDAVHCKACGTLLNIENDEY